MPISPKRKKELDKTACTACGGSGKSTRGWTCHPCDGTGKLKERKDGR